MKKVFCILFLILIFCPPVFAETTDDILKNQFQNSGADGLSDSIPDDTSHLLRDSFGEQLTTENAADFLSFKGMLAFLISSFFSVFKKEALLFASVLAIVLLNRLFKSFSSSFSAKSTESIVDMVSLLALILAVSANITTAVGQIAGMIDQVTVFTESLVPVMSTLMVSGGQPAEAGIATVFLFMGCEICSYISAYVLLPLINIYFAAVICESLIFEIDTTAITEFIKKLVTILSGTLLTLFVAMMTLQSVISGAGDSLSKRGVKFAVGALLPMASGVLSEAMETVFSCANVARSLTGIFGIVVIVFTVTLPLLMVISKYLVLKLGAFCGKVTGGGKITGFLDGCASVFGMLLTLSVTVSIILISTLTLVIMTIPK